MSINGEPDENKIDFELLSQRLVAQTTSELSSDTSTILSGNTSKSGEVWPLHLTPKFIDHYITGDLIGSGSYAEVRECVDTRTLERCALKIINKEYLKRQAPRALANQLQEIRLLRHFRHANIISMRECLLKGSFIYMALEYCSFNLNELLNDQSKNKFNVVLARRFFHQLCFGVKYLHSMGIIHRDIKPDNLLLTNSGVLKIIDFGVSHILSMWSREDLCSNYEGTPLFQAPEVISGQHEYHGFKVDVWSCGVTLFLMLFGTYPFMDETLLGLYDKILSQELEVVHFEPSSSALTDLLASMLEKDCLQRASIDQVLKHPWLKLCLPNLYDSPADESSENSEFFELVTSQNQSWKSSTRDVYRSMSVLPYLYRHHYPKLPIRKSRSRSNSPQSSVPMDAAPKLERISSISSVSTVEQPAVSSRTTTPSERSSSTQTPPEEDKLDVDQVEWGTEEQYQLMKVPQVRANRVRQSAIRRRKRSHPSQSDRNTR